MTTNGEGSEGQAPAPRRRSTTLEERVSRAVAAGEALRDPREAATAADFARVVQARLQASIWRSSLRIGVGFVLVWLLLIVVPVSFALHAVHWRVVVAGVFTGWLVMVASLAIGWRQLRLARRAEARNERVARSARGGGAAQEGDTGSQ